MNRNSLEDFRAEVKALKVPEQMARQVEELMDQGLVKIEVTGQLPSRQGYLEATLHVKCSAKSDYYYFNKYDLALSKARPLEEGKSYMIVSPAQENGVKAIKHYQSPVQAIRDFKNRENNAELMIGKSIKDAVLIATVNEGKVNYTNKEFKFELNEPLTNTVYVNKGLGFNLKQSANMLQDGAAYRDDLVSRLGKQYEAWNTYKLNEPRDNYGNLKINQYSEGYGFNLEKELQTYNIKELNTPEKFEALIADLKDGERPLITAVDKSGLEQKLHIEAMPRFYNINFYQPDGTSVKREDYQKQNKIVPGKEQNTFRQLNAKKDKDITQTEGMSI
ncbi:hypothetical protein DBR43_09680 [Pedobacter sp. KBW06]|uniref:hypothetical protein n=1 Tax=Pedobacter sp. KBW06 TaxID=2153359 RepID=UPI000F5AC326|nr:hypothetical protein [Pedobacter sp. KBW06]RQO75597.1 hypothetical protein DBR43_09680 [Pedobacter sp. KBW06]